MKTVQSRR